MAHPFGDVHCNANARPCRSRKPDLLARLNPTGVGRYDPGNEYPRGLAELQASACAVVSPPSTIAALARRAWAIGRPIPRHGQRGHAPADPGCYGAGLLPAIP